MSYQPAGAPSCYGTEAWSATAAECVGGLDPTYVHPETSTRIRERCKFFSECSRASATNRATAQRQFIPTNHLTQYISPVRVQTTPQAYVPPRPATMGFRPAGATPIVGAHQQPQVHQAQYVNGRAIRQQAPGNAIHSYLANPEPDGPHWVKRLGREMFRSVGKSLGHSIASFFDFNTIGHDPNE